MKKSLIALGLTSLLACGVAVSISNKQGIKFSRTKAGEYTMVFNNENAPSFAAGTGSFVLENGVKWEYSNASAFNSGFVTLGHQGYLSVANGIGLYGITDIESVTATFSGTSGSELWLLESIDGITWYEAAQLESGVSTTEANGWRFLRFYSYSIIGSISISNITIEYSCSGVSASDDVDSAKNINVLSLSSNLVSSEETTIFASSDSTQALRLTNTTATTYGVSHDAKIKFDKSYTYGEIKNKVVEFDYYHKEKGGSGGGYPQVRLTKNGSDITGYVTITSGNAPYCFTDLNEDWWHISIPVSSLLPSSSIVDSQVVNSIRIFDYNIYNENETIGFSVIDNLRFTAGSHDIYLVSDSVLVNVGETVDIETVVVGSVADVLFESNDDSIATVDNNGTVTGLAEGETIVTATYHMGYNREEIIRNISVKVSDPDSKYSTGNVARAENASIMNNAPITIENVNNEHYGDGIRVTFTSAGTESQYVLRINLPANMLIKGDNQYGKFKMTVKYGISGSYYYTNGQRYRLTSNGTRVSTDAVQASTFNPVASGNDDNFYHYSCDVSAFGVSSGAKDTSTFNMLELMIRPAAIQNDTIEMYGIEFSNITDYTLI